MLKSDLLVYSKNRQFSYPY